MKYDVFLSFRGEDTRDGFTSHLKEGLLQKTIRTFMDEELEKGDEISPNLLEAIEESKISVVVFSRNYASSKWCLDELVKIMDCKKTNKNHLVIPVFYRIDPSDVRYQTGSFADAFVKHVNRNTQKVETWRTALTEAANISGWDSRVIRPESRLIEEIVQDILKKLNPPNPGWIGQALSTTNLVGVSAKTCMEEIWAYLMGDDVQKIGVWGMGGIGKTTIMKLINNQLLKETEKFKLVVWVTVSKEMSISKVQNGIAGAMGVTLDGDDETIRAGRVYHMLLQKGRHVLILDDLWDRLSLEEVGIPEPSNGSKLLVTTRSLDVCRHLDCREVTVPTLSKQDAWRLFSEKVGKDVLNHLDLLPIVQSVAEECAGLPLAIVTIASSMKRVCSVHEWRNALDVLKRHVKSVKGMEEKIFQQLQFSYDRLQDEKVKHCFLFCALYPEDFEIKIDELINLWIAEGLVEEMDSMQEIDTGHTILNVLKNSCLIENCYRGAVKLHDVVRDMALRITRERPRFLVRAGMQLKEILNVRDWNEDLERVSLMTNGELHIPSQMLPLNCPNLTTLFLSYCNIESIPEWFFKKMLGLRTLNLSYNRDLKRLPNSISNLKNLTALLLSRCSIDSIPESFFEQLHRLKILDLSGNKFRSLPNSISKLENLTALLLSCCSVDSIPESFFEQLHRLKILDLSGNKIWSLPNSISNLKTLTTLLLGGCEELGKLSFSNSEVELDLGVTNIKDIPHVIERLVNLNYLDLSGTRIREMGDGILTKFTSLHHLNLGRILVRGEEIGGLMKLEFFKGRFYDFNEWKSFAQILHASKGGLSQYNIYVSPKDGYGDPSPKHGEGRFYDFNEWKSFVQILHASEGELSQYDIYVSPKDGYGDPSPKHGDGEHVIEFNGCNIRTDDFKILSNVEVLSFKWCIVDLWEEGVFLSRFTPMPNNVFSSLSHIVIWFCDNIKKLFNWVLLHNLQNLESLSVFRCKVMEEIIASESELEEYEISSPSFKFILPKLSRLELCDLPELKSICGANGVMVCDSIQLIHIYYCPKLKRIPLNLLQNLENLEICHCKELEEIIASASESELEEEGISSPSFNFTLPKLRRLSLIDLPELKSICGANGVMICDSLQRIHIYYCPKLKRIPLNLLQNLEYLEICYCKEMEEIIASESELEEYGIICPSFNFTLPKLRQLSLRDLPELKSICGANGVMVCDSIQRIHIYDCPKLKRIPLNLLQNLENLEICHCKELEEIIASESESEEEGISSPSFNFTLPKLHELSLIDLPELKSICGANGVMICDSIEVIVIRNCPKLKRIPLNLPLQDDGQPSPPPLKVIEVSSKGWWELVEWDHPNAKSLLEPLVYTYDYYCGRRVKVFPSKV